MVRMTYYCDKCGKPLSVVENEFRVKWDTKCFTHAHTIQLCDNCSSVFKKEWLHVKED